MGASNCGAVPLRVNFCDDWHTPITYFHTHITVYIQEKCHKQQGNIFLDVVKLDLYILWLACWRACMHGWTCAFNRRMLYLKLRSVGWQCTPLLVEIHSTVEGEGPWEKGFVTGYCAHDAIMLFILLNSLINGRYIVLIFVFISLFFAVLFSLTSVWSWAWSLPL